MPVSGNEEVGVKKQSNFDISGVPLKKRIFFRHTAPPVEEETSIPIKNDSLKNEPSNQLQKSIQHVIPSIKEENLVTVKNEQTGQLQESNSLGVSRVSRTPCPYNLTKGGVPEETKRTDELIVQTDTGNSLIASVGEPGATVNEEKQEVVEKPANSSIKVEKADQKLSPVVASEQIFGKEMSGQQMEGKLTLNMSASSENPEISLVKQNHASTMEGDWEEGNGQNRENLEFISLNLSLSNGENKLYLSNGENSTDYQLNDGQSNSCMTSLSVDRSNWDLNATMDTWEGSSSREGSASDLSVDYVLPKDTTDNTKSMICSPRVSGMDIRNGKEFFNENVSKPCVATAFLQSSKEYNIQDSFNLCLAPNLNPFKLSEAASLSSSTSDTYGCNSGISLPRVSVNNVNIHPKEVKSESLNGSRREYFKGAEAHTIGPLGFRMVKHEVAEVLGHEALKLSSSSACRLSDSGVIKSEPFNDNIPVVVKRTEVASDLAVMELGHGMGTVSQPVSLIDKRVVRQDSSMKDTSSLGKQLLLGHGTTEMAGKLVLQGKGIGEKSSRLMDQWVLQNEDNGAKPLECVDARGTKEDNLYKEMPTEANRSTNSITTEMIPALQSQYENVDFSHKVATVGDKVSEDPVQCETEFTNEDNLHLNCNRDDHLSDDEKINLSGDMLEDDSYDSDSNSNRNTVSMDIEESCQRHDEYEDGEVREQGPHIATDGVGKKTKEMCSGSDNKETVSMRLPVEGHSQTSNATEIHREGDLHVMNIDIIERDIPVDGRASESNNNDASVKAASAFDMPTSRQENKVEPSSDQITSGGDNTLMAFAGVQRDEKANNFSDHQDPELPNQEMPSNDNTAAKNNRSRIINLSIGKSQSLSGTGKERLLDVPLEETKLQYRGRDGVYDGGVPHKFLRDRTQDHSYRNTRLNFGQGRGEISSRVESLHGDRDSERGFSSELHNGSPDFFVSNRKYGCVMDQDADFTKYNFGPDNTFVGNIRQGRKMISDDDTNFRRYGSRRRSPGARDRSAARDIPMVRRAPRNIVEEESEVIGLRHAEKMLRRFSDGGSEHTYVRQQPPYGLDGHFVRGRNFSYNQRRALHSKSPIRSQSPGPWSSSRRSPDGFGGRSDMPLNRSPPVYRVGSPNPGEVMRRHGSPYFSRQNDMREVDSGHDYPHSKSFNAYRSPNRVLLRKNSRRFGIVDPQERNNAEGFPGGSMHSSRFHDPSEDGNGEDMRRFGQIRGHGRPFRRPYSRSDIGNFHHNGDEGPRSFRYLQEFHGRPNARERDFDRRIKHGSEDVHRRPRTVEELEENYRHVGQVQYEDNYDDMSRMKRKRF